jgi:hypothetical protein
MAHSRAAALFPLFFVLAGCPVYGSEPVSREVQVSCQGDVDCPSDTFCDPATNSCIAYNFGICLTDGDCPVGSYCDRSDGGCYIPAISECDADGDCLSGFECDFRHSCRPKVDDNCLGDADCASGELCVENSCTPVAETCQFDFQCSAGFACANSRCRLLCGPQTTCPSGTACTESLCQPRVGECVDSSECPDLRTNCVEGICLRRCEAGCDAAIEVCDGEGFCRPRTSPDPNAPHPFCRTDGDCDGSICVQGVCRTQCDITAPSPDDICASYDGQVPLCGPDNLCYLRSEIESDCRVQDDCPAEQDCIDGNCR